MKKSSFAIMLMLAFVVVILYRSPSVTVKAAEDGVEMQRLYNPNSGEHFYTASLTEAENLEKAGWSYEGRAWTAPKTSNTPVYRLYNENSGEHHYTTNASEKENLIALGWKDEDIGWYSDDASSVPLYRLYNPNAKGEQEAGAHHYTTKTGEKNALVAAGWQDENIGWYGAANLLDNTISDEAKTKAASFPSVDGDLPEWRGTNIVEKAEFAWPWASVVSKPEDVEDTSGTVFVESEADDVAELGYDFVRICIDNRYFFTEESKVTLENLGENFSGDIDTVNLTQYENLDDFIEWCILRGIHVCIDCHSTPGGLMIGNDEEEGRRPLFTKGSKEQDIFVRYWHNMAARYADVSPNALSFNLYNEPPAIVTETEDVYVDLMNRAIDEITAVTPERLIFVDMMSYAMQGMKQLSALHDCNLAIGWHLYASGVYSAEDFNLENDSAEAVQQLADYAAYAKEHNVRWMLQEYGIHSSINEADREAYVETVLDTCKKYNAPAAMYAFNECTGWLVLLEVPDLEVYGTPGATYAVTQAGHYYNEGLAKISVKR